MLIDDHPLVRDGLRARLETVPGLEVVAEAGNAEEALAAAALHQIDLTLMDINMRGINGIELTARFHALHPEIAVLILSMHDKAEYVMQSIQAGARGYVLKDAPSQDIVHAIETVRRADLLQRRTGAPADPATAGARVAHAARARSAAAHCQWRIEQADRPRAGPERAYGGNPPAQHQAQAQYRWAGGTDQICGGVARAG
jgi:DNA-binding NarL/FixJ family response regulator